MFILVILCLEFLYLQEGDWECLNTYLVSKYVQKLIASLITSGGQAGVNLVPYVGEKGT